MHALTALLLAFSATALPAQGEWYVSPTGNDASSGLSPTTALRTIRRAVELAFAGDVIRIGPGVYGDEQGLLALGDKEVALIGSGTGSTVLRTNHLNDQDLPTGPTLAGQTNLPHRVVLAVRGPARVDLRDLTLDAGFIAPLHGRVACLFVSGGGDAVCDRVDFVNARPQPLVAAPTSHGIVIRGDAVGDDTTLTLRNCRIREHARAAITAAFTARIEVEDCAIDGQGSTDATMTPQVGIECTDGARALLRRVAITDCRHAPATATAVGIALRDAGEVVIADCSVGNCELGLHIERTAASANSVQLRRNTIHGAELGVHVLGASGVVAEGNSFHADRSGQPTAVVDDGSGNAWNSNYYSNATAPGPLPIPGSAGATDPDARPNLRGFDAPLSVPMPVGDAPVDVISLDVDAIGGKDFAALTQSIAGPALCIGRNLFGGFQVARVPFGMVSTRPIALVDGEFDGQPGRDLAVLTANILPEQTQNRVYLFANNGNGSFAALSEVALPAAIAPNGLAVGNVDGGLDDLVATDAGAGVLAPGKAYLLRNSGGGVFAVTTLPLSLATAARDAAVFDGNGDGKMDVAVIEGSPSVGSLHVLVGDGAGTFAPLPGSPLPTTLNPQSLAVGDLDGDVDLDLLVACARDVFGTVAGALDVFENRGNWSLVRAEQRIDRLPRGIAVGRLDGPPLLGQDRRDVAIACAGAGSITLCTDYARGFGFAKGGHARTSVGVLAVALGDMTGDGLDDLVYADGSNRMVVIVPRQRLARIDSFGPGWSGTSDRFPVMRPTGSLPVPSVPANGFAIGLANGWPNSIAVIGFGVSATPSIIDGLITLFAVPTNAEGAGETPIGIPANPALVGQVLFCQGGVFDPNAQQSLIPPLALTQVLRLQLGF